MYQDVAEVHDTLSDNQQTEQRQEEEKRRHSPVVRIVERCLEKHHQPGAVRGLQPRHTVVRQVFFWVIKEQERIGDRECGHQQVEKTVKLLPQNPNEKNEAFRLLIELGR